MRKVTGTEIKAFLSNHREAAQVLGGLGAITLSGGDPRVAIPGVVAVGDVLFDGPVTNMVRAVVRRVDVRRSGHLR